MNILCFLAVLLCSTAQDSVIVANIRDYSRQIMSEWRIPGMSVSVVKDSEMIMCEGFGVKKMGGTDSVSCSTLFHVGSITKSFTGTVMASVVDDGLISWDDLVTDILPDFEWGDPEVGKTLQIKDLFTHHSGLCRQVGTYIPNLGYEREDIYKMFKYIEPIHPKGCKFAYNNITFIIAARAIEVVTGKSWEDNVRERIFAPLGMTSSTIGGEGYLAAGDSAACPHYFHKSKNAEKNIKVGPITGDNRALHWVSVIGPAGAVCSTAEDMAKYVTCHLYNGAVPSFAFTSDSISSTDSIAPVNYYSHNPFQVVSPEEMAFIHSGPCFHSDSTMTRSYGYCWYIEQNKRYEVIYHTGTTFGFTALCGFFPELGVSFTILCNSDVSQNARFALMRRIADLFLMEKEEKGIADLEDYSTEWKKEWVAKSGGGGRPVPLTIRKSSVKPEFSTLVGHYSKPAPFGNADVTMKNGRLYLTVGPKHWTHELKHSSGNMFLMTSQGHTFPIYFHGYEKPGGKVDFEIDFNYNENFGPWIKR